MALHRALFTSLNKTNWNVQMWLPSTFPRRCGILQQTNIYYSKFPFKLELLIWTASKRYLIAVVIPRVVLPSHPNVIEWCESMKYIYFHPSVQMVLGAEIFVIKSKNTFCKLNFYVTRQDLTGILPIHQAFM